MYLAVLFVLQHSQKKPANPWGAKDAGSFFIKFYFCTVLIFLGFGHFFLLNTRLPQQCELQDSLGSSSDDSLCTVGSYDATQRLCTIDPARSSVRLQRPSACSSFIVRANRVVAVVNAQSSYFLDGTECSSGYPLCVCEYACGPFVSVAKGYAPLSSYIASSGVAAKFYSLLLDSNVVPWVLLLTFLLGIFFLRNSLTVYVVRVPTTQSSSISSHQH
jgi:hypothetical protein